MRFYIFKEHFLIHIAQISKNVNIYFTWKQFGDEIYEKGSINISLKEPIAFSKMATSTVSQVPKNFIDRELKKVRSCI